MIRFRGETVNKVDSKGRVSIPAPFRRVLEEGDPDWIEGQNPTFVIVYGRRIRNCLEGYSIRFMNEVDDLMSGLPRYSKQREILERILNTQSIYVQVDENGRIVLPMKLRDMVEVKSQATFAGMGEKFQIWEPSNYLADLERIEMELSIEQREEDIFALLDRGGGKANS